MIDCDCLCVTDIVDEGDDEYDDIGAVECI
jgi:hypothetical protein